MEIGLIVDFNVRSSLSHSQIVSLIIVATNNSKYG